MNRNRGFASIAAIGIIVLFVGLISLIVIKSAKTPEAPILNPITSSSTIIKNINITSSTVAKASLNSSAFVKGSIKKIEEDLDLFVLTDSANLNNLSIQVQYYEAGIIQVGKYKGYKRILAVDSTDPGMGPGATVWIFATKDYQSYILDSGSEKIVYEGFNLKKVLSADSIPNNHPMYLNIGNNFYYVTRENIDLILLLNSQNSYDLIPNSNLENAQSLESLDPLLKLYATSLSSDDIITLKYLSSDVTILVQDQTGLTYTYSIVDRVRNQEPEATYFSGGWGVYPDFLTKNFDPGSVLYESYGMFLPGGCGGLAYVLKNIEDSNVRFITKSAKGQEFYTLKDPQHPLNKAEYDIKVGEYGAEGFAQLNGGSKPPSFAEYVSKNPILLTKDPWGRWIAFGETEYKLEGGCGKPVLYFYPSKPTEISLRFNKSVYLTTDIPTYSNGWEILANPDGILKDLQTDKTNCQQIDSFKLGSEYAKDSCITNNYPYIYWSGFVSNNYPVQKDGSIVSRTELLSFITEKLSLIGLNKKEINDMTAYWVPELLKKEAPYYRISFLQNRQMGDLVPMTIIPHPDSVIRVFMDWSPLQSKPSESITPQQLIHYERNGFVVVEWGGLKQ